MRTTFQAVLAAGLAFAFLSPDVASADQAPDGGTSCGAWEIEYALAANLRLTDTPMGEGNGLFKIGPGTTTLRFEDKGGQPGGNVQMLSYTMSEQFSITAKTLVFKTTVVTDTKTSGTPNACGSISEGSMSEQKLTWTSKARGYHTDGTLDCTGSMCGKFGAPPAGKSELHIPKSDVQFHPWEMSADRKTFTMPYTFVAKTKQPQQTAYIALSGREVKRTCVPAPKACP